jgi:hypothetical protein
VAAGDVEHVAVREIEHVLGVDDQGGFPGIAEPDRFDALGHLVQSAEVVDDAGGRQLQPVEARAAFEDAHGQGLDEAAGDQAIVAGAAVEPVVAAEAVALGDVVEEVVAGAAAKRILAPSAVQAVVAVAAADEVIAVASADEVVAASP